MPLGTLPSTASRRWGLLERTAGIAIDADRAYRFAIGRAVLQNHYDTLIDERPQIRVFAAGFVDYRS